ncbi:MAG: radical SAM protein, partial [Anaerolineales bacterium]|nr:radical SAM protein [Anaerolineales bacterium]
MYAIDEVARDAPAFRQAVQTANPYKPLYVKIKLIWTCNLRCGMCNHWRSKRDVPLGLAQWQAIVDELVLWGCRKIHITGGEPTLHPDLPALIAYMTDKGLRVNMTTNGTLLTKERARALGAAGLGNVNISIDSPERQIHDHVRGVKGAWKKTVKGADYLQRYLKKGKLRINTVVGRRNYASLAQMPDFAASLGADFLNLIPLDEHTGDLQRLRKEQILAFNEEIAPGMAERGLALGVFRHEADAYPFGVGKTAVHHSKKG